ncbi:unnamed protein product [Spirodela intermedia]|uniref:Uncharacterized protein n=2 Tax=Spirodela intermedia TaxID=51605 RepID=A0A7I8JMD7_SPIIN|nr:unnamed protein product [Spirodela intermedia]CAA6671327.1 unnamed protein product [Spirodela intermedia]CAA7408421.1 unnamed protein product [Spirodela intermedia]
MKSGSSGKKGGEGDEASAMDVRCLDDLLRYTPAAGEAVLINVPLETKLSEYKKIVEYADAEQYELLDDRPGMGFSWSSRVEEKLIRVDHIMEDLARKTDHLKKTLDKIDQRRAADSGG